MGRLTTHVLDIARGVPAGGVTGRLCGGDGATLLDFTTNDDGRCAAPLLEGDRFRVGHYTLMFWTAAYFAAHGVALADPPFLDTIRLDFAIADAAAHYHVPLLVSPWSFSTYRGS
jgi:5-hydroxyisourate hydrolase